MKVLVACEYSGRVREAFRKKGHDAWSCDLLPAEDESEFHIQGDVLAHLYEVGSGYYDLIIHHSPCTFMANSGVRWMYDPFPYLDKRRLANLREAGNFFNQFRHFADKVAGENPIPHKFAVTLIGKYDQIVQPWQFGHGETKATCLWLYGLPKLQPTNIVEGREQRVHKMPPGPDRWKERSRTYQGIADAMAEQWG